MRGLSRTPIEMRSLKEQLKTIRIVRPEAPLGWNPAQPALLAISREKIIEPLFRGPTMPPVLMILAAWSELAREDGNAIEHGRVPWSPSGK
jgi:hypothetical protein